MVRSKKINYILLSAVFLSLIYYFFGTKIFLTAFVGICGILLVIYDIKIGLFASAFLYPFVPDALGLIMLLSMGFFVLLKAMFYKENFSVTDMGVPIGIFAFIAIFSTITSIDPSGSVRDLALNAAGISFVFAMTNSIKTKKDLNTFVSVLLFSSLVVALLGVFQYFTGVEMRPEWLDTENNTDIAVRVYSVFLNPNILAEYLVLMTPLAVGMTWYTKSMRKKFLFLASTAVLLICLVMTLSRGGWVGIALAALAFVLLVDKRLILIAIPIVLGVFYALPQKVLDRIISIGSTVDSSNLYRIKIWKITKDVIRDNLIAGVGFGYTPFKETFEKYIRTMPIYHAHNTYLEVAAEIGLIGFIFFMLLLFSVLKYNYVNLIKSEDKYYRYLGAGLYASIIGIMGHGLVEHFLYIPRIIFTFWIIIGITMTAIRIKKSEREKSKNLENKTSKKLESKDKDLEIKIIAEWWLNGMKKIVVSGYFGFDNSGDDAILKAMVEDFKKLNKEIKITALSKNPEKTKKIYGIDAVDRFSIPKLIKTLKESDILLSGGGSLLQDVTSTRSIIYYLTVIKIAKFFHKKVYVYANGIGPIEKKIGKLLTRRVLNKVDYITLRDELSYEFVKELGVKNENIKVTSDPVFTLKSEDEDRVAEILKIENIEIKENTIGFCIRDYKKDESIKEKFAKAIDLLIESGYDILLVPFHTPRDNVYSQEVAEKCVHKDKVKLIKNTYSAGELMGIFKKLELLAAMRLHSLIYAASVNLPMVGIIYDPKVEAMVKELGIKEYVDVEDFSAEELYEEIRKALNSIEERKIILEEETEKMRSASKENVEIAIKLLEK